MSRRSAEGEERGMAFTTENDFEGGTWENEEFYYASKRGRGKQTRDQQTYGVFGGSSGDEDEEEEDEGGGELGGGGSSDDEVKEKRSRYGSRDKQGGSGKTKKRSRTEQLANKPVMFVSTSSSSSSTNKKEESLSAGDDERGDYDKEKEEEEDDSNVKGAFTDMLSSLGKKATESDRRLGLGNADFRKMLGGDGGGEGGGSKIGESAAAAAALPPPSIKGMGTWQKHTKGIGLKLLQKFGFKGRLGKQEDGMAVPVDVVLRPTNVGLGFGDTDAPKESSAAPSASASSGGVGKAGIKDGEGAMAGASKQQKKLLSEEISDAKSWKKGRGGKVKAKLMSVSDVLGKNSDDFGSGGGVQQIVLDMRGQETKVLSNVGDMTSISEATEAQSSAKPKLGQELLYNVNLVVDLMEVELANDSRKLATEARRTDSLQSDKVLLESQLAREKPSLERLEKLSTALKRIDEKRTNDPNSISIAAIVKALSSLYSAFDDEFKLFGVVHLMANLATPIVQAVVADWSPLMDPLKMAEVFADWLPLASFFSEKREMALEGQVRNAMENAVERLCMPKIRRALTGEWEMQNASPCVLLMESLQTLLSRTLLDQTLEMMILPRLIAAVNDWNPSTDAVPIHTWLHPWLPLLGSKLSVVYPEIRRKFSRTLNSWHVSDRSALVVIRPWLSVFDKASAEALLVRSVVPKLVSSCREMVIEQATSQDMSLFASILSWLGVVPDFHFLCLLEGEFFPKWLQTLSSWLKAYPDLEDVSAWYEAWKSAFPADLVEGNESMRRPFNLALEMMNSALLEDDQIAASEAARAWDEQLKVETNYFKVLEARSKELTLENRLHDLSKTTSSSSSSSLRHADVSFKQVVESFASQKGVVFVPKEGRTEDGKQLYSFNSTVCFMHDSVIYAKEKTSSTFRAVSLETLFTMSSQ